MHQLHNSFTSWEMSPRELMEGKCLNINQRAMLQTMLAQFAEEKLAWTYDSINQIASLQREAELAGQIKLIKLLLDESDVAEKELLQMAQSNQPI